MEAIQIFWEVITTVETVNMLLNKGTLKHTKFSAKCEWAKGNIFSNPGFLRKRDPLSFLLFNTSKYTRTLPWKKTIEH